MSKPVVYVFLGLIASGKSTLAEMFSQSRKLPYHNTDRVRKELAGMEATERGTAGAGQGIYTTAFTEKTYGALLERAAKDLQNGADGVVLDGSYSKRSDRAKVIRLADQLQAEAVFIVCSCSDREVKRRLAVRAQDPNAVSDGNWEIFVRQKEKFEFPDEISGQQLIELDTESPPDHLLQELALKLSDRKSG